MSELDTLARQVFDAGIIGAGGAGFPTHKKLVAGAKLLVVNATECEPLLASDRYAMRTFAPDIIEGITTLAEALAVPRVVIGTKAHYSREIAALKSAIAAAGADIEIHLLDSFYPAGDEQVLIYEITGESVPPAGIPIDIGIIVVNVTTALNVARAVHGAPVTRRYVTVTGEVAKPTIVDAPVGTTAADLIAAAGGAQVAPYAIVRGGPMMGKQFTMDAAANMGFGKADSGLIVLPWDHPLINFGSQPIDRIVLQARSICIQCRLCTDMCPRFLIGHQMRPHRVMRSVGTTTHPEDLTDALLCCECGICELYACPMGLSPRRMNQHVKGMLRADGIGVADHSVHEENTADRQYRHIATGRLIERLHLGDYPTDIDDVTVFEPTSVTIPLRHGVGKPSTPTVGVGDQVEVGQVIAAVDFADVGCVVHASIAGRVSAVEHDAIRIERS